MSEEWRGQEDEGMRRINKKEKPIRKRGFDDETKGIPKVKSTISAIDGRLVLFTGSTDRVSIKFDKDYPDASLTIKSVDIEPQDKVLIYEAANGYLGLPLALTHTDSIFFLFDSNITMANLASRNLNANIEICRNVAIVERREQLEQETHDRAFDVVVYRPKNFSARDLILRNILEVKGYLKPGGKFYLISHTKRGAREQENLVVKVFGHEVKIAERGKGGYRIIEAKKNLIEEKTIKEMDIDSKKTITFNVLGRDFNVETDVSLFSKDDIDSGTRLLLENVALNSFGNMLDMGCGWGAIGIVAASINPQGHVVMTDTDSRAIDVAKNNVERLKLSDRVAPILADGINERFLDSKFDLVLSNPPFHETTTKLISTFNTVKRSMTGNGRIFLGVEKTYLDKFQYILQEVFGNIQVINNKDNYFILRSHK